MYIIFIVIKIIHYYKYRRVYVSPSRGGADIYLCPLELWNRFLNNCINTFLFPWLLWGITLLHVFLFNSRIYVHVYEKTAR